MASLLILQTATDAGLGSCFIGIPPDKDAAVREAFGIPDDFDPVGVVTIGHHDTGEGAAGSPTRRAAQAGRGRRASRALGTPAQSIGVAVAGQRATPAEGLASETSLRSYADRAD